MLKPKWANTLSRGVARTTGTLVGSAICALFAVFHSPLQHWTYFTLILVRAFVCFALEAVNYALFSSFLTMYTVFLFAFGGFSERSAADIWLINTAIGAFLALLVDFIAQRFGPHLRPHPAKAPQNPTRPEYFAL